MRFGAIAPSRPAIVGDAPARPHPGKVAAVIDPVTHEACSSDAALVKRNSHPGRLARLRAGVFAKQGCGDDATAIHAFSQGRLSRPSCPFILPSTTRIWTDDRRRPSIGRPPRLACKVQGPRRNESAPSQARFALRPTFRRPGAFGRRFGPKRWTS
jgi:hypothetical protein